VLIFGFSLMIDVNSFVFKVGIIDLVTLVGSFGTATRPWAGKSRKRSQYIYWASRVSITDRGKIFVPRNVQTESGSHPASQLYQALWKKALFLNNR